MSEQDSQYIIAKIEDADVASGFRCGKEPLDNYFARYAVKNHRDGIGITYVLRGKPENPAEPWRVLGFYTVSMAHADAEHLPPELKKKLPKYPMPVALIGRFAIDQRVQGKGLGGKLLFDAFRRIVDAANILGCVWIVVDAKDEDARRFYEKFDFISVPGESWPRRMMIAVGTVRAVLAGT